MPTTVPTFLFSQYFYHNTGSHDILCQYSQNDEGSRSDELFRNANANKSITN